MAKETRKQIIEQTRNEVARIYKQKITELEEKLDRYVSAYGNEARLRQTYQNKMEELQEKVNQYEDWNRRLQEFMDMEPDAREKAFAEMKVNRELNEKLHGLMGLYGTLFGI